MKNTIITLASVAALAVSANAQTYEVYFLDNSGAGVLSGADLYHWDSTADTFNFISRSAHAGGGWEGLAVTAAGTHLYDQDTARIRVNGLNSDNAPTVSADGTDYVDFATLDGINFHFLDNSGAGVLSGADLYTWDSGTDTFTFVSRSSHAGGGWEGLAVTAAGTHLYDQDTARIRVNGLNSDNAPTVSADGTDYAAFAVGEVVPEPSSTALLGLGGLALILRRRK